MITRNGVVIRQADNRHKFASPMAEYLYEAMLTGAEDESVGNSTDGPGILIRIGRRVLLEQPDGSVSEERLPFDPNAGPIVPRTDTFDYWAQENYPEIYFWDDEQMYGHDWHGWTAYN